MAQELLSCCFKLLNNISTSNNLQYLFSTKSTTFLSCQSTALGFSIERWDRLSAYVNDGRLNIDNNTVKNSIRPVTFGRKNYLYASSHEAAKRSGMLYSLPGTCKMHGIEPYAWLKAVLHRIADHPVNHVAEPLPHRYEK